jgi:uncharacterized protein YcbK (DUF882 family)
MAEQISQEQLDELAAAADYLSTVAGRLGKNFTGLNSDVNKFARRSIKNIGESLDRLEKHVQEAGGSYRDSIGDLNALSDAIKNNTDTQYVATQKQKDLSRLQTMAVKAAGQKLTDAAAAAGGEILKGYTNYYLNQIRTGMRAVMSSNASAFQAAADLQVTAADDANRTVQGVAGVVQGASAALMLIPHPAAKVAGALGMLGASVVSYLSDKDTDLFKERVQVLAQAAETTFNSFNTAANAGAVFARGAGEFRDLALGMARLPPDVFAKVIMDNRMQMAEAGYSVSEGAKIIGKVMARMRTDVGSSGLKFREELANLGFSVEEQAGLIADVTANLKRMGGGATVPEVEQATAAYAKNLRLIAEVTGDDAKKRMEQARSITDQYAFNKQFISEHKNNVKALADARGALGKLQPEMQRAVAQIYTRGATIERSVIVAGQEKYARQLAALMHKPNATMEEFNSVIGQMNDQVLNENDSRKQAIASGAGFSSSLKEYGDYMTRTGIDALGMNSDALNRASKAVDQGLNPQDSFTKSLVKSSLAMNDLRTEIQGELTGSIKQFAEEVPAILSSFREKMDKIGVVLYNPSTGVMGKLVGPGGSGAGGGGAAGSTGKKALIDRIGDYFSNQSATSNREATKAAGEFAVAAPGARGGTKGMSFPNVETAKSKGFEPVYKRVRGMETQEVESWRYGTQEFPALPGTAGQAAPAMKPGAQLPGAKLSANLEQLKRQLTQIAGFRQITATMDQFHMGRNSKHNQGLALDFTLDHVPDATESASIIAQLKGMGAAKVLDEYSNPSQGATGGHFHVEVPAAARGGITRGITLAGEAGAEAIVPLPDGRSIPVQLTFSNMPDMSTAMREMPQMLRNALDSTNVTFARMLTEGIVRAVTQLPDTKNWHAMLEQMPQARTVMTATDTAGELHRGFRATDFSDQLQNLVTEVRAQQQPQTPTVTSEQQRSNTLSHESMRDMITHMREHNDLLKQQHAATAELLREAKRGNRTSREILQSNY